MAHEVTRETRNPIERLSNYCQKTKTKVTIPTTSNQMNQSELSAITCNSPKAWEKSQAYKAPLVFVLLLIGCSVSAKARADTTENASFRRVLHFYWPNQPSSCMRKAGLASRNIVLSILRKAFYVVSAIALALIVFSEKLPHQITSLNQSRPTGKLSTVACLNFML